MYRINTKVLKIGKVYIALGVLVKYIGVDKFGMHSFEYMQGHFKGRTMHLNEENVATTPWKEPTKAMKVLYDNC